MPAIVVLIPELINKDRFSKDELLIDIPKSIRLVQMNYSVQNSIYSSRILTILLFLIESISALMCSLISIWYFFGKAGALNNLLELNCFEHDL